LDLFTAVFLIYFTIAVLVKIRVFRLEGDKGGQVKDNWTFPAIYASYFVAVWGSLAEYFIRSPSINLWISFTGYVLATGGIAITRRSVMTLGRWWSIRIEIKKDHQVVEKGPYRVSRHPYYLGALLELVGLCLILNSLRTLVYVLLVHATLVMVRTSSEEKVLLSSLGTRYLDYKKKVGVFPLALGRRMEAGRSNRP
jgi:protein-S-isoprenylcysteine O-methyltransferase Ste14